MNSMCHLCELESKEAHKKFKGSRHRRANQIARELNGDLRIFKYYKYWAPKYTNSGI